MHRAATMASSLFIVAALLLDVAVGGGEAATFTIINRCSYTVWPGGIPDGGGTRLDPGQLTTLHVAAGRSAGRIWPRTGCKFDDSGRGRGSCVTGDCSGVKACSGAGQPPTTLAEYTLGQPGGSADFYDLSLVDGFNVPMSFSPVGGGGGGGCRAISCAADITAHCPAELKVAGGCASACEKLGGDTYCCRGQYTNDCPPTSYSKFFKNLCPDAYSYAKDDQTSTFTCLAGTDYQIVFCP